MPYHRLAGRGLCSPPSAKAYGFVSGSKIFTQSGGGNCFIAGSPAADFAPRRSQRLTASSRGAKSSHKAAAEIVLLPATGSPSLLPAARKGLRLRFGSKIFTQGGGGNCLITGSPAADLLPAVRKGLRLRIGGKIFTQSGGGNRFIAGSPAADFAPRRPQRLTASFRGAKSSQRTAAEIALSPARRPRTLLPAARKGLRLRFGEQNLHRGRRRKSRYCRLVARGLCSPPPAKAYGFRSGEQNLHRGRRRKSRYCRLAGRGLCSPPPAKAYGFVRGSKIFTEGGGGNRLIAGNGVADFAPRRPQRLTASYRGAKSSHKAAAEIALLPARRLPTLLPAARKGLRLRFGEQNLHRGRRRKSRYRRLAGRGLCSPPPAKAYGFVSGSKIFTEGGGENRVIADSSPADFAPRRPQRLTAFVPGEQNLHTKRRRKSLYCRLAGCRLCSPPPAKAYGFVRGSKIFTEGGGSPIPAPVSAVAVENEKWY